MWNNSPVTRQVDRSLGFFTLMLLAIFASELAVNELLNMVFGEIDNLRVGAIDALLLVIFFTPPLWVVCNKEFSQRALRIGELQTRWSFAPAMALVLAGIFVIEVGVTLLLPHIMPGAEHQARDLADACLSTLFSGPALWWLLLRKSEPDRQPVTELLVLPLRLYVLLLVLIFMVDLVQTLVISHSFLGVSESCDRIVDAFLTTIVIAPLLWLFVVRPLKRVAQSDRARASALHDEVNDAIVAIDSQGMITSFNPACQRIFGYEATEMTGKPASTLFPDGSPGLEELIPPGGPQGGNFPHREVTGRTSAGMPITLEVSISRLKLDSGGFLLIMRDVSDRKKSEQVLLESLSLQQATLESTADGILAVDLSYRVRTYNTKFLEMWQLSRQLVETGEREDLLAALFMQIHEPHAFREQLEELYSQPGQTVMRNIRLKDGRVFECYSYPQLLEARVVGRVWSFRDVSEKTAAEEALRSSEELFRQVFDQTEDAILFFGCGTCRILDLNRKAERVFGYSKQELLESGLEQLCQREDYPVLCGSIIGTTLERPSLLDNIACRRKDGGEIVVTMRGKILTLLGSQVIYCTFRDVTDRIRMEREARNIQSKLIQANKMTSLGLLVSGVAHEINNPNNYIMANARLLSRAWHDAMKFLREYYRENGEFVLGGIPFSELEAHSPELFEGIIDGTLRIDAIINNLKGFARQERTVEEADVDLNMVANSAVTLLHHELVKFTGNFQVHLEKQLPKVRGNVQQLGQVLINLLTNACHALPDKSRGICLSTGFDPLSSQVTISVKDEGCGITKDDGSRIMEPFFTTKLDTGGTGLGLSICCSIIKDHAGTLEYTSEPGRGTTFTVKLPAQH
jgi:PAS domain S-box-containing protein